MRRRARRPDFVCCLQLGDGVCKEWQVRRGKCGARKITDKDGVEQDVCLHCFLHQARRVHPGTIVSPRDNHEEVESPKNTCLGEFGC